MNHTIKEYSIQKFYMRVPLNSSPPIAAYMRQWAGSALVQAMACSLFGAKTLPGPMLINCRLNKLQWNSNLNSIIFIQENATEIGQSHRYGRHQAACREPAGSCDKTTRIAICFEHKTQYLLIRAPYTRIVVSWHISNIPPPPPPPHDFAESN